jgi:hypothetical protein
LSRALLSKKKNTGITSHDPKEIPTVQLADFLDAASVSSAESEMMDSLRVEIANLKSILDKQDHELRRQCLIIQTQGEEIHALKCICSSNERQIHEIDAHLKSVPLVQPPPVQPSQPSQPYKEALQKSIPEITSSIIREQDDRSKRVKNIVIRERGATTTTSILSRHASSSEICSWLQGLGASTEDTSKLSIRVIPARVPTTPTTPPTPVTSNILPTPNCTLIVTLPQMTNRTALLTKLKRNIRGLSDSLSIFIDPDLTPTEAKEQFNLRSERNRLNGTRSANDKTSFHYGIRGNKVIKIPI